MKIQIMSDLHLEFEWMELKKPKRAKKEIVLVLAGDTIPVTKGIQKFKEFLLSASNIYKHVIVVAGNHEFYGGEIEEVTDSIQFVCDILPNVTFLDGDNIVIDDVAFIGATLWTDLFKGGFDAVNAAHMWMNDFRYIFFEDRFFTPDDWNLLHQSDVMSIEHGLKKHRDKKCVVITHHAPSFMSIPDKYRGELLNYAYATSLEEKLILKYHPIVWIHGHTHESMDYDIGDTGILCNPRGYNGENANFDDMFVIEM